MKVRLIYDDYIGEFFKKDKAGRWRKVGRIGNTGVAIDVAETILKKLGHKVEFVDISSESLNYEG